MGMFSSLGSVLGGVAGSFIAPGIGTAIGAGLGGALGGQADNMQAWNYSKKAQSRQNAYQTQMWMLNNDYNSPKSVMARLEEAGLNPNLVYGNGGASYQATMPTAAKASFNYQNAADITQFQQHENMEAQEELTNQNLENAREQNRIIKANARIAEKDAQIYEKTGVRPGDDWQKGLFHGFTDKAQDMSLDGLKALGSVFKWFMSKDSFSEKSEK